MHRYSRGGTGNVPAHRPLLPRLAAIRGDLFVLWTLGVAGLTRGVGQLEDDATAEAQRWRGAGAGAQPTRGSLWSLAKLTTRLAIAA